MRKKLLLGVFSLIGVISTGKSFAQETHFTCGSHTQMKKLYAENPGLEEDYKKLLNRYKENRVINGKSTTVRVIPIVFHIVHEYGVENVTDQQIQDQMTILNEDFLKMNADTNIVIAPFDTIIGDAYIEFRLATLDPWGNCTNGIEHIYNHNTNQGDDYSKLSQWDRDKYLNVWLTKTIGSAGVAGYAYYPTGVTGTGFFRDGIIILHDYVGSIGTGSPGRSRALTHEIGHWLGLAHTWGNDNDPGSSASCGQDDGIKDTPNCIGMTSCNLSMNSCDDTQTLDSYWGAFDPVDNAQNYMDYSYCSVMFTKGQADFMNNVLDQETSGRSNLFTAANLAETGTSTTTPVTCAPLADFYVDVNGAISNTGANANVMSACVNDPIAFKDASWKAGVTSWAWSFPGATPSTSTSQNPTVTYAAPGWYDVTLTVSNSVGSDTKTINHMVYIQGDWAEYTGPRTEDFNQNANFWISLNPENNDASFQRVTSGGRQNSACFKLNNWKDVSNAQMFTDDWYYYDRLANSKDYLITPALDLRSTSNVNISFDYAYGTKATATTDITEKLVVYYSRDCGKTWVQKTSLTGAALVTAGYVGNTDYTPNNDLQWKTVSFTHTPTAADNKIKFKIEFTASDFSSNFYFDNFNVSGTLGIEDNGVLSTISIAPNPVATGSDLAVEVPTAANGMKLIVMDLKGAIISTTEVPASSGVQTVNIPMNVAKGCYILNAVQGAAKSTHRVVVY
ncbi:M43 family zinc metalloprotease [uncultured Fluviicola sp.]|uniref:M43 family zinc metalloprotease n=1 Tax=uncultured Fluviicola sp. TaxID=463303 RepID=UPI0025FFC722|nr:M43 family zinc metalloprotease [uncultured Fluviicola sp.]